MDPQLRSQYKAALKDSGNPGPKSQQKASTSRRTGGHTSNLLPETYDDTEVIGLTANGSGNIPALFNCSSCDVYIWWSNHIMHAYSKIDSFVC